MANKKQVGDDEYIEQWGWPSNARQIGLWARDNDCCNENGHCHSPAIVIEQFRKDFDKADAKSGLPKTENNRGKMINTFVKKIGIPFSFKTASGKVFLEKHPQLKETIDSKKKNELPAEKKKKESNEKEASGTSGSFPKALASKLLKPVTKNSKPALPAVRLSSKASADFRDLIALGSDLGVNVSKLWQDNAHDLMAVLRDVIALVPTDVVFQQVKAVLYSTSNNEARKFSPEMLDADESSGTSGLSGTVSSDTKKSTEKMCVLNAAANKAREKDTVTSDMSLVGDSNKDKEIGEKKKVKNFFI